MFDSLLFLFHSNFCFFPIVSNVAIFSNFFFFIFFPISVLGFSSRIQKKARPGEMDEKQVSFC